MKLTDIPSDCQPVMCLMCGEYLAVPPDTPPRVVIQMRNDHWTISPACRPPGYDPTP